MISIRKNGKTLKIVALVLFLVVISFLLYNHWKYRYGASEPFYFTPHFEVEDIANYQIIETSEGRSVVNNNMGLTFSVPDQWSVEMLEEEYEVEISSPNMEGERGSFPLKGCVARVGIVRFIQDFPGQELRPQVMRSQIVGETPILEDIQEIVMVNNRASLKTIKYEGNERGEIILIELPIDNTIYHFGIIYASVDEEKCKEKFNEILDSVLIN